VQRMGTGGHVPPPPPGVLREKGKEKKEEEEKREKKGKEEKEKKNKLVFSPALALAPNLKNFLAARRAAIFKQYLSLCS